MSPTPRDPATIERRSQPAYPIHEAARYVKVPVATLRSWVFGREYEAAGTTRRFPSIVTPASRRPPMLSFWNLVEAHVLRALRTDHGVPVKAVRTAVAYAEKYLGVERLLLSKELQAGAGSLFLERYGALIELSASGQIAMRQVFEAHLKRVVWDSGQFPIRLHPFIGPAGGSADQPIAIDPAIAFGRPIVVRRSITTAVIAERIDLGESVEALMQDYSLDRKDIEQAILYERAA